MYLIEREIEREKVQMKPPDIATVVEHFDFSKKRTKSINIVASCHLEKSDCVVKMFSLVLKKM